MWSLVARGLHQLFEYRKIVFNYQNIPFSLFFHEIILLILKIPPLLISSLTPLYFQKHPHPSLPQTPKKPQPPKSPIKPGLGFFLLSHAIAQLRKESGLDRVVKSCNNNELQILKLLLLHSANTFKNKWKLSLLCCNKLIFRSPSGICTLSIYIKTFCTLKCILHCSVDSSSPSNHLLGSVDAQIYSSSEEADRIVPKRNLLLIKRKPLFAARFWGSPVFIIYHVIPSFLHWS